MTASRTHPASRTQAGFSFLEMVVVMGILAVLMGLTVGVLTSTGAETLLSQARAILTETAFRVKSNSEGGGRQGVLIVEKRMTADGNEVMQVGALIASGVLTHHFEKLEDASNNVLVKVLGAVELAPNEGYHGSAASFKQGGYLELPSLTRFAMTQGLQIDVRVKPASGQGEMVILRSGDSEYRLSLFRKQDKKSYGVRLSLKLFSEGQSHRNTTPESKVDESEGTPVRADAGWQRIQVAFDGIETSIRVNGIEYIDTLRGKRRRNASLDDAQTQSIRTIAIPQRGATPVVISDASSSFVGLIDSLHLRGVFRSDELQRDLPTDLELINGSVPVRVVYVNGRLDPDVHRDDVVLQFRDPNSPQDLPIELRLGRNGTIESKFALQDASAPTQEGKK